MSTSRVKDARGGWSLVGPLRQKRRPSEVPSEISRGRNLHPAIEGGEGGAPKDDGILLRAGAGGSRGRDIGDQSALELAPSFRFGRVAGRPGVRHRDPGWRFRSRYPFVGSGFQER